MTEIAPRSFAQSITVDVTADALYDLVSDVTRTGEWSPVCRRCCWDDEEQAGQVGSWFTGFNELPDRSWETRSQVVAADRGREFAWMVGGSFVRWGYTLRSREGSTELTETWDLLAAGITRFADKFGDRVLQEIDDRTELAHEGIPRTLAAIKRIAESS